ncbi:MAG TPA: malto-oligosyltrehalose synthase [Mycobacteriales bacterium]|jgi:(1->4)-alpha-D-glucan 1-alpha-D-glucosylmutase|nr:malto-oligosyltrehalose synthase [Mycobacteriales bacterium]
MPPPGSPTATYRLQLRREFGFRDAAAVVPYLAALGVSHVYCSPVLEATPGSAHGYDVVDHSRLSPELGGDDGWAELAEACRTHGLGIVIDVVPNHMAVPTPERLNAALWGVLRDGRESEHAAWFDIDWDSQDGKLLMPVLGDPFDDCVARNEIEVDVEARMLRYFDHEFPLAFGTEELADDIVALHAQQHYRLAHWRVANTDLNYRRFFDVTSLIGVRVELPEVFDATHARLLDLVRCGDVDGLRIDHPDGLADPAGYLDRLAASSGRMWTVVEKILEHGEVLPTGWACDGTTGYDALASVSAVLTDPAGEKPLTETYVALTGEDPDFTTVVSDAKRQVVTQLFPAEIHRLVRELRHPELRDLVPQSVPDPDLFAAIAELLVCFDVYRAYPGDGASADRIDAAVTLARTNAAPLGPALDVIEPLLRRQLPEADSFAVRFEQTTGPVMAKGVEDTAFYRYLRLTALSEVGGDPRHVGMTVDDWHANCERLARDWPRTMTTLSTHDTKRSEDVRARLLVLAEIPDEWTAAVSRWQAAGPAERPDANTCYVFWQSLVGAHPISADRLKAYLAKATREAKRHTSWTDPDESYDQRVATYVDSVLADEALLADVDRWIREHLAEPGASNSLSQKLLQLTMPGIPDVYQGEELTDFSLVDPDNRRPVDYDDRRRRLTQIANDQPAGAALDGDDVKLLVTSRTLQLRRDRPATFAGGYAPLTADGLAAGHVVAYRRGDDVVAVVTRLPVGLRRSGGWRGTTLQLPEGSWRDVLTGRPATHEVASLLADLPVALLVRAGG